MASKSDPDNLRKLRQKLSWLLSQAAEYDTGRPEIATENAIFAAHKCAEMAASYREQANNLAVIIAATEEANAQSAAAQVQEAAP